MSNIEADIISSNIEAKILTKPFSLRVTNKLISAKISNVLIIETGDNGGGTTDDMSITYNFTANDLVNGKLIRTHNLNKLVDVSVYDSSGKEIMAGLDILNLNQISIDLSRATVSGTWRLLVE